MKKLMIGLFSLVLALSLVSPVCAEDDFTPSISGGKAPGIVTETIDGEEVVGYVVDADKNVLATVFAGCLGVVTLEDAQDKESNISDSARKTLLDLYEDLLEKEIKLSEELPELNKLVEEKFGKGNNADNMVVRDLMLADLVHKECKDELRKEGTTIDVTFEMKVEKGTFLQVATFIDGEWTLAEKVVINDDDTVTVTFEDLCPVLFLVPGEMNEEVAGFNWWWLAIIPLALLFFLLSKKSNKEEK